MDVCFSQFYMIKVILKKDLENAGNFNSILGGHPDTTK